MGHAAAQTHEQTTMSKPELIYVYDALCGWCYGFSPVMQAVYEKQKDKLDFSVVSGGLMTGDRIGPIREMAEYIKGAIPRLEQTTGVTIGEGYKKMLDEGTRISNSVPPAIALGLFRRQRPDQVVPFAAALQKANFIDGQDLNDISLYGKLVSAWGLDSAAFVQAMQDPANESLASSDFQAATDFGITGFPAVILRKGDKYYLLARGYTDLDTLEKRLQQALEKP